MMQGLRRWLRKFYPAHLLPPSFSEEIRLNESAKMKSGSKETTTNAEIKVTDQHLERVSACSTLGSVLLYEKRPPDTA